ncbi:MAG: superoxide dismutase [Culturomica sp.]|jgi:Fe-Mn family superoxide dismutase|nr:superoxide dismutase [Culturomica sp.]
MDKKTTIKTAQSVLLSSSKVNEKGSDGILKLQLLPYSHNALEPYISERTIDFHYGKHLATYVDNTNKQKSGTPFADMSIEEIMLSASGGLFNNSAQVYNHYFQFEAFQAPNENNAPTGNLKQALEKEFGSIDEFKKKFAEVALGLFGSGYTWLVDNNGKLEIQQTHNAENPLTEGKKPLLNLDVWEHAYYLDVQNARAKYVENFWKVLNWSAVEKRFEK